MSSDDVMATERTPLTGLQPAPSYVFMTNESRQYRKKKCTYCLGASLLALFILALVITTSVLMNHTTATGNDTTTTTTSSTTSPMTTTPMTTTPTTNASATDSLPTETMGTFYNLSWPLAPGKAVWASQPTPTEMEAAIEAGKAGLRARDLMEENTVPLEMDTPSNRHQTSTGTGKMATKYARAGYIEGIATKKFFHDNATSARQSVGRGPQLVGDWLPPALRSDEPRFVDLCSKTPYRSVDGVCNNPNHPRKWGVALRPFRRLLPPDYADGVSDTRVATDGSPLPSARAVSVLVHRPSYKDDPKFTVMLAVWGQFMDHDITATALSKGANMSSISCCYARDTPEIMHPECFPVRLADGDPYYNSYNVSCMEFVRSAPAPVGSMGPREQLNQATSYLDGSVVYGADPYLTKRLRSFQRGQLKMETSPDGRSLLPYEENPIDGCNQQAQAARNRYCFLSGDLRANENLHLTTMHLIWARHHNDLANQLHEHNPEWDDERLFQEARRILGAQMQHITYKEFLPVLLGEELMTRLNFKLKSHGYHDVYNASVDPTVANEFASSAFRFAHTLLPSLFRRLGGNSSSPDYIELHKLLFDPFKLYTPGNMDSYLRGAFDTNCQRIDTFFTKEVTEKLFQREPAPAEVKPKQPGLDLVSLNIQRGRDHGLPGYPRWRKMCGLSVPSNFSDLVGVMDEDTIQRLSTLYKSVDDVDMYSGALSEYPVDGGTLGPTIMCVLADQFYRTKIGDRFWYETPHQPQAFTPEQLQEIRKTTLASIICENSDNIEIAQPWVMRLKKTGNYPVPCYGDVIQHPDISMWEERDGTFVRPGVNNGQMGPPYNARSKRPSDKEDETTPSMEDKNSYNDMGSKRNNNSDDEDRAKTTTSKEDFNSYNEIRSKGNKNRDNEDKAKTTPSKEDKNSYNDMGSKGNKNRDNEDKTKTTTSKEDKNSYNDMGSKGNKNRDEDPIAKTPTSTEDKNSYNDMGSKGNKNRDDEDKAKTTTSKEDKNSYNDTGSKRNNNRDDDPIAKTPTSTEDTNSYNDMGSKGNKNRDDEGKAKTTTSKEDKNSYNYTGSKKNNNRDEDPIAKTPTSTDDKNSYNDTGSKRNNNSDDEDKAKTPTSTEDKNSYNDTGSKRNNNSDQKDRAKSSDAADNEGDDEELGTWRDPEVKNMADDDEEIGLWSAANGLAKKHSSGAKIALTDGYVKHKFTIISGWIIAVCNGSAPEVWWNGTRPMNMSKNPQDSFSKDSATKDAYGDLPVFGEGVLWRATLIKDVEVTHINGKFFIPVYNHGAKLSLTWWSGSFSFIVALERDLILLDNDTLYSSRVYFHNAKTEPSQRNDTNIGSEAIPDLSTNTFTEPPSSDVVMGAKRLPIILSGFNRDNNTFTWSGDCLILGNGTAS